MSNYQNYHPESKVWIYQADRFLNEVEKKEVLAICRSFTAQWNAHGHPLDADVAVFEDLFIVFYVNKNGEPASGCSIDKQLHVVKQLEQQFKISLTNRLVVAYRKTPTSPIEIYKHTVLLDKIAQKELPSSGFIYNNTVTSVQEMNTNWLTPFLQSWMAPLIPATL